MRHLTGTILAVGIGLCTANHSNAQFPLSIGNPYYAQPAPGYYAQSVPSYGYASNSYYTSGYVAMPGTLSYSSGYRGYAPIAPAYSYAPPVASYNYVRPINPYGYQNRPYYGAYGYGNYSNGSTDGFRPFRNLIRGYR